MKTMVYISIIIVLLLIFFDRINCQAVCNLPAGGDRRVNKFRLKIVHFNVYWLFYDQFDVEGSPWTR
jgi:hypothetical protein